MSQGDARISKCMKAHKQFVSARLGALPGASEEIQKDLIIDRRVG
jgi:hypothetical protein